MKIFMNENWPEIVESLLPYFKVNSREDDYQREIENCLKYLGWKKTNGTMCSQLSLPIGSSNAIRPDVVLLKDDNPVLPIEIKRPLNVHSGRQENQLMSYMRQLRLNVGLLIGEKIELYYDVPYDGENPVCVFSSEINRDDAGGSVICDLLEYKRFSSDELEKFCKEQYNKIMARNNLHQRLNEFLSEDNGVNNVISLLKEKFASEGFDDNVMSLNMQGRNGVPLVSDSVSDKYGKYQRRLQDGRYLFSNFSTKSIKAKIEQIAQLLSVELNVEIIPK